MVQYKLKVELSPEVMKKVKDCQQESGEFVNPQEKR
jgi:hypothetical protein